jgi:hypothetical protein
VAGMNLERHFEAAAEEAEAMSHAELAGHKNANIHLRARALFEMCADNEASRPDASDAWSFRSDPTHLDPFTSAVIDLASAYLDEEDQP